MTRRERAERERRTAASAAVPAARSRTSRRRRRPAHESVIASERPVTARPRTSASGGPAQLAARLERERRGAQRERLEHRTGRAVRQRRLQSAGSSPARNSSIRNAKPSAPAPSVEDIAALAATAHASSAAPIAIAPAWPVAIAARSQPPPSAR